MALSHLKNRAAETASLECDISPNQTVAVESYSFKIQDPEICSENDTAPVSEYLMDIFSYLRELEDQFPIQKDFLENHETSTENRAKLIDWLVGVHSYFNMFPETLYLCVEIVDSYLEANKHVGPETLQLVGITSLLVAGKYEEARIPKLRRFRRICARIYSKQEILTMENTILRQLNCRLGRALSVQFLKWYSTIAQLQSRFHWFGNFMMDLSLLESEMSHVKPSLKAAAACCLSLSLLDSIDLMTAWTPTLIHHTGYEYSDLRAVIASFSKILDKVNASEFQHVRKKFSTVPTPKSCLKILLRKRLFVPATPTK